MITDRTLEDVLSSKRIRESKIQKFAPLTEEEKTILEKGILTVSTLNRIEEKQDDIKSRLQQMGYFDNNILNKKWSKGDIFVEEDFKRIVENNKILLDSFYALKSSPSAEITGTSYEELNSIEKLLQDIEKNALATTLRYRKCGTFVCGG